MGRGFSFLKPRSGPCTHEDLGSSASARTYSQTQHAHMHTYAHTWTHSCTPMPLKSIEKPQRSSQNPQPPFPSHVQAPLPAPRPGRIRTHPCQGLGGPCSPQVAELPRCPQMFGSRGLPAALTAVTLMSLKVTGHGSGKVPPLRLAEVPSGHWGGQLGWCWGAPLRWHLPGSEGPPSFP